MYTELTRRIDNLGRITIPKEFRKLLNLSDGDIMDIGIQGHEITIRKHYPLDCVADYLDDISVFLSVVAINSGLSMQQYEKLDNKINELKNIFYDL